MLSLLSKPWMITFVPELAYLIVLDHPELEMDFLVLLLP
jgi:hypothetical protein